MLSADDVNALEDWVQRLERVRDDIADTALVTERAAEVMRAAASSMYSAASTMNGAALMMRR